MVLIVRTVDVAVSLFKSISACMQNSLSHNNHVSVCRDDQEKLIKFFGESPNRFIYEKAPPRGWQEGKRDITGKVVTVQYHDDGKQDPYKVNIRPNFCRPEVEFPNPKK